MSDHVGPLLDRYRTGELAGAEATRVATHLETCAACRAALSDLEAFATAVERGYDASREMAPEPDWAALRSSIVEQTSAPRRRRGWFVAHVPQVAAAAVAVLAVVVVLQQGIRGPDDVERALAPADRESSVARSQDEALAPPAEPGVETEGFANRDPSLDALEADARVEADALGDEEAAVEIEELRRRAGEPPRVEAPEPSPAFRDAPEPSVVTGERRANEREGPAAAVGQARREAAEAPDAVTEAEADLAVAEQDVDTAEDGRQRRADDRVADADDAQNKVVAKDRAADPSGGYAESRLERFEMKADSAFAEGDTLSLRAALSFYRDSLDSGLALNPEAREAARAIADSLAARLATHP